MLSRRMRRLCPTLSCCSRSAMLFTGNVVCTRRALYYGSCSMRAASAGCLPSCRAHYVRSSALSASPCVVMLPVRCRRSVALCTSARPCVTLSCAAAAGKPACDVSIASVGVSSAAPASPPSKAHASRLVQLERLVARGAYDEAARLFERAMASPSTTLTEFCDGATCDVRDVVLLLMRMYASLGRMRCIRHLLMLCMRDMASSAPHDAETATAAVTPATSSTRVSLRPRLCVTVFNAYLEVLVMRTGYDKDEVVYVLEAMRAAGITRDALTFHYLLELHVRAGRDAQALWWQLRSECAQPPLPATVQLMLLRVLPHCNDAVLAVDVVREAVRHGPRVADKRVLTETLERWLGMSSSSSASSAAAGAAANAAHDDDGSSSSTDTHESGSDSNDTKKVTRESAGAAHDVADDDGDGSGSGVRGGVDKAAALDTADADGGGGGDSGNEKDDAAAVLRRCRDAAATTPPALRCDVPVEHVLWLMHELEMRCVLEVAAFTQHVHKSHVAQLLLRCARAGNIDVASAALALMDRHAMTKTADILALVVWCCAQAGVVCDALDVVEQMARRGQLELLDAFRRHTLDCVRVVMDRNFLMLLIDALDSPARLRSAHAHLRRRRRRDGCVSVHSLDILVAAAARLGELRFALRLVAAYTTEWAVQPRTNTYNSLLVGCATQRGTALHRGIYAEMRRCGVAPNAQTFRVLIRQAVLADSIDEAVGYLNEVAAQQQQLGVRVEVEMLLPLLERASRVGDAQTACRVSQFSLDCDIGIDAVVMQGAIQRLADAGCAVDELRAHVPLHDALRARSKVGRLRAHSALVL